MWLFIVTVIVILILYLISIMKKPPNYPPGPSRWPIVGNTFFIKKLSKELGGQYKALLKLHEDYKSNIISLKLGSDEYVVVFGRKLVQQVFTRDEFQGRPDGFFIRLRTMGTRKGITMTDGQLWHEQRNFAERQLRQLGFGKLVTENLIKEELDNFLTSLGDKQEDVSLNKKLSSSFLNVLWTITGGKQFSKDDDKLDALLILLRERSKAFDMAGGLLNQLPWLRFIAPDYCGYTCIQSLNAKLFELFQGIISEHKKTITSETRDFVDAYLHEKESANPDTSTFTDEQLVAICLDFFIAGALTTSYTLDFAVLATASNPSVQQKLHEELDKVLKPKQIPSIEDKARLPYVEALLLESQRFQHVVPTAGPRRVLKDTSLDGYLIPKNTIVLMSLRSIHYDEARWNDPEVFRPERFLTEDGQLIPDEGLCTFGLGKRRCPGEVLAKSFLFLAFAALFNRYKITFPDGKGPSSLPGAGILLTPQPYTVNLEAR
ncbi:probable cytochrome P450 305a1 isoform X2 [Planococcus citri]|uniref:probable cytochrome P450 305a1 isoform X2 n=1 Tax=Planococcus citri TaxID=170843 RepID=UPI0031F90E30